MAQRAPDRAIFVVADEPAPAGEQVAKRGQSLMVAHLHAEAAARLDEDVVVANGWGRKRTLKAGTTLFAATTGPHPMYCATGVSKGAAWWGSFYPCFRDPDGTGKFTLAIDTLAVVGGGQYVGVLDNGTITDISPSRAPAPQATPLSYTVIPRDEGPVVNVRFLWRLKQATASKPAAVEVWTNAGSADAPYSRAVGQFREFPLAGDQTGRIEYAGAEIAILGVGPDGSLRYRVERPFTPGPMPVFVRPTPNVIYLYL